MPFMWSRHRIHTLVSASSIYIENISRFFDIYSTYSKRIRQDADVQRISQTQYTQLFLYMCISYGIYNCVLLCIELGNGKAIHKRGDNGEGRIPLQWSHMGLEWLKILASKPVWQYQCLMNHLLPNIPFYPCPFDNGYHTDILRTLRNTLSTLMTVFG